MGQNESSPKLSGHLLVGGAHILSPAQEHVDWHPWWSLSYGQWRLRQEREAMARFPSFRLVENYGDLCWLGPLTSSLTGKRYQVRVRYPGRFPDSPPIVTVEKHTFPVGMPHLQGFDKPCLFMPGQGSGHGYDPGRTTAATLVAWTALWIHAYETWCETGEWPGVEV
jgi:hypothetical protein